MNPSKSNSAYSSKDTERVMTSDEFDQVIEAIVLGRYSWACILILRIAGYNPLHYLPYRTYRRLIKENTQLGSAQPQSKLSKTQISNVNTHITAKGKF